MIQDISEHERVVLYHPPTGTLVDARAVFNQRIAPGGTALFEVSVVRGLPVERAIVNTNKWRVYQNGNPELIDRLLDRIFTEKENN